jgi:protein subunit release factor B
MQIERDLTFAELETHFAAPEEWGDAYVVVQTQPGDSRAPHWATQLVEIYIAWAARHGFGCMVVDEAPPEDGEWRITLAVEGNGAYGLLQAERGTHRFAEIVPVGEARRKHVAQVRVEVLPVLGKDALRMPPGEISVDSRPLHARGRRLRKLRGEARAVHQPTGTAAQVASDSDTKDAESLALALLCGRLYVERAAERSVRLNAPAADPPWGSVARAYQLSRRSSVKDPRTGVAHPQPRAVFAGDIDRFIAGYLQMRDER